MQGVTKGSVNMEYRIYKFSFKTAVHFGEGNLSTSSNHIFADTFFSAICVELERAGCTKDIDRLARTVKKKKKRKTESAPFATPTSPFPRPLVSV